jgi:uncharacterized protein YidB (DUF937 family)
MAATSWSIFPPPELCYTLVAWALETVDNERSIDRDPARAGGAQVAEMRSRTMFEKQIKRISGTKVVAAGIAVALIAGFLIVFAGQASAARVGMRAKAAGCVGVLMHANTLDKALGELVTNGTLTQAQADAVKTKVGEDAWGGAKACAGLALLRQAGVGPALQKLLGMNAQQIRADFKSGKSLTEIAASKSVDRQTLVTTIETAINTEIDKLVTNGKMSATQAATIKTNVAAKVEKAVDLHKGELKAGMSATPSAMATPAT